MKQRILLIVAILLIATPAFAVVDINVTQGTGDNINKLTVRYNCTASETVRAFALDLTLGSLGDSMTFFEINDFNRGESNKPGGGYGIFPGQFRNQIDPANPNWFAQYYYPIAPSNDVDSNGQGVGERKVIVELGTLYKDSNAPGTSGTLFTIRVDPNGKQSDTLNVALNNLRGGVVLENGSAVTTNLPTNQTIVLNVCPAAPATITYPAADGNNGRYQVSWAAAADATGYKLNRSADGGSSWVQIYAGADTTVCDDVNTGSYMYRVCSTKGGCSDSAWTTGAGSCAVVLCFPTTSGPNMANWKALGKPRCWCYERQCLGDATGTSEGTTRTGVTWVGSPDLTVFMQAYGVVEPTKGPGLQGEPNICADFSHTSEGTTRTGITWVGGPDLTIFMQSYGIVEPTKGPGIGTCVAGPTGSRFTLPTDNKPCN